MPEQFEALGLDTDAGGRQAIHKLQAWALSWELDAVREQDTEVTATHNRAEQFDSSTEAIFIPLQVCCAATDHDSRLAEASIYIVCVCMCVCVCGKAMAACTHQCRALGSPQQGLSHRVSGVSGEMGRAAVYSA